MAMWWTVWRDLCRNARPTPAQVALRRSGPWIELGEFLRSRGVAATHKTYYIYYGCLILPRSRDKTLLFQGC